MTVANEEIRKAETGTVKNAERIEKRKVYVPQTDIFENGDSLIVVVDMPGVDQNSVEITLEKNLLTLYGAVDATPPEGHTLTYSEFRVGDFKRSFTLSNEIDQERIHATMKQGVLRLTLPKAESARAKKIPIQTEA